MLLVKSSESRNSGNKFSYKTWGYALLSPFVFTSFPAFSAPESLSNPTSVASIFLSLLLVVAIVVVLALIMRRFNVTQSGGNQMKVVASMMAGSKERVVVVQVGDEQHMLGITAHNINHLAKLEQPLATESQQPGDNFKDKLVMAMAGKLAGNAPRPAEQSNA